MEGALPHRQLQDGKNMYMEISNGFKQCYGEDMVLLLKGTVWLKEVVIDFWEELLKAHKKWVIRGVKQIHAYTINRIIS